MADVLTKKRRSEVMALVRSRGNKVTELKLAFILRAHKIVGWRRHLPLPGRPDFAFRRERLAIFVDGCFWHGCRWHLRLPQSNCAYWESKIRRNVARDRMVTRSLKESGWRVLRFWEHSLKSPEAVAERIKSELSSAGKTCKHATPENGSRIRKKVR